MVWLVRFALIAIFVFLIGGIRWMTEGLRVRDRNHRLSVILLFWTIAMAAVILSSASYVWNDGWSFVLAGLNVAIGLPSVFATLTVYFANRRRR